MGKLINFLGGINMGMMPAMQIAGIIFNTPEILRSPSSERKTIETIKEAKFPLIMVDSGGYQIYKALDDNRKNPDEQPTLLIMNAKKPIYGRNTINLTAGHVLTAVELLKPRFVVSPDIPVPKPVSDQGMPLFLASLGYNEFCARRLSDLLRGRHIETSLLIPLQLYDLDQLDYFLRRIEDVGYNGFSIPRRIMTGEKIALFALKARALGVPHVHVLGSSRFSHIVIMAYMARNYLDLSFDSTNILRFSTKHQYLQPYSLMPIDVRLKSEDDLTVPIQCDCPWCSYYKSFFEIQHDAKEEKVAFLINHNFFVVEQLRAESMDAAGSAASLSSFLWDKAKRYEEIRRIDHILGLIESFGKAEISPDILKALFKRFCQ